MTSRAWALNCDDLCGVDLLVDHTQVLPLDKCWQTLTVMEVTGVLHHRKQMANDYVAQQLQGGHDTPH